MDLWAEPEWLDRTCFSPFKLGDTFYHLKAMNSSRELRLLSEGIETPRTCAYLRDEERAAHHREVFHEHDELHLVHHGVGNGPEVVEHRGDGGQEKDDEPRADSGAVAEKDRKASSSRDHAGKWNRDRR